MGRGNISIVVLEVIVIVIVRNVLIRIITELAVVVASCSVPSEVPIVVVRGHTVVVVVAIVVAAHAIVVPTVVGVIIINLVVSIAEIGQIIRLSIRSKGSTSSIRSGGRGRWHVRG